MSKRIFIGAAWPYANGPLHLGHIAGAYLPADIFARYHRLKGNNVLMVSGSDEHGTPITIRAEQEGKTPAEIARAYHEQFLASWQQLGISFDIFTHTDTLSHYQIAQDFFLTLLGKGYIYKDVMQLPFCPHCQRSLPDRYVEGVCPNCGYDNARGDQCDHCGHTLAPEDLIMPHCRICNTTPTLVNSEHFFFRLSAFQDKLLEWVTHKHHWRANVMNHTLGYLRTGLRDRAITRDVDWGVPLPIEGYEKKRLYVWFEAVIGYLSASMEWASAQGEPEKWHDFWQGDAESYYFIGKDNIPFHTIIWPAMLMGYGNLNLPYDVPANEYLTIEGEKLSSSRNWAVWLPDYLERYEPDPLRYILSVNMPDTADTNFSWGEFIRRNNDELVATYGNLAQRVLTFAIRHFDSQIPEPSNLDELSNRLIYECSEMLNEVGELLTGCHFKQAIKQAMTLAQRTNRYLELQSPWKTVTSDRQEAANAIFSATTALSCLATLFYPFLPFSSEQLSQMLGFSEAVADSGWQLRTPHPGQRLGQVNPLFRKLDEGLAEVEVARMQERLKAAPGG